jgi:competence protein ComGC
MRRRRTHICEIMVIMLVIISLFTYPQSIQAKSNNAQIKKLVGKMESYEYKLSDGKNKVKLTKTEMAKAAALSIDRNEKNQIKVAEFGEDNIYKISNKKLKAAGKNLFGITISSKNLPTTFQKDSLSDAYRKKNGTAVVSIANIETETDYVVHSIKITKKSGNTYRVKKNLYYGYWGSNNGQSNYQIVYQVKPSSKSVYGYKITMMKITAME